ncbi:acidic mammalian chitinase-like isoform X2 [Coccinella septempunctata]|nr:acidic mammalian chitinase-like isoform X2 [Coccinella septempunctata]XP_044759880.1 acidic mammalian chitinase-like isoform X2 [Coccinella septempunctata]XP_044759881.1 acidic mammalian chitinase-like isoform X2 [Coccinella septempunctata]XP_044759883.1 acidic mammalian chitinase-like isoform X2 [Coccinella septempunctata]
MSILTLKTVIFLCASISFMDFILQSYAVVISAPTEQSKRIVCYYTFPTKTYNLKPQDIDSKMCTHIIVGFVTLDNGSIDIDQNQKKTIEEVIRLKKKNTNLKVMLSIGGGGGQYGFPEMVNSSMNRNRFIQSMNYEVAQLDLDGIDLDWEFPNNLFRRDRDNFIDLLKNIRQNINNSVRKYLISVAVAAPITIVEISYDVPEISRLVDFVNLMSYDYNFYSILTPWTGMNAPLYARSKDFFYFKTQNINYTSNYWLRKGMAKEKINIGLPVYAHTYKLASPNKTYLGAPSVGDGVLGGGGSAKYGTICEFMQIQSLSPVFDEETKSPYVTNGSEWVSFENEESMKYKAQFVRDNGFGGVMVFSLNSDDYDGTCETNNKFPNTKMIHRIFVE